MTGRDLSRSKEHKKQRERGKERERDGGTNYNRSRGKEKIKEAKGSHGGDDVLRSFIFQRGKEKKGALFLRKQTTAGKRKKRTRIFRTSEKSWYIGASPYKNTS